DRTESGQDRKRQRHPSAEEQPAEHVAAVAVGAKQQERRTSIVSRQQAPAAEPSKRNSLGSILLELLLEAIDKCPSVNERRAKPPVAIDDAWPGRRRVQQVWKSIGGSVRRHQRCADGASHEKADERPTGLSREHGDRRWREPRPRAACRRRAAASRW